MDFDDLSAFGSKTCAYAESSGDKLMLPEKKRETKAPLTEKECIKFTLCHLSYENKNHTLDVVIGTKDISWNRSNPHVKNQTQKMIFHKVNKLG